MFQVLDYIQAHVILTLWENYSNCPHFTEEEIRLTGLKVTAHKESN